MVAAVMMRMVFVGGWCMTMRWIVCDVPGVVLVMILSLLCAKVLGCPDRWWSGDGVGGVSGRPEMITKVIWWCGDVDRIYRGDGMEEMMIWWFGSWPESWPEKMAATGTRRKNIENGGSGGVWRCGGQRVRESDDGDRIRWVLWEDFWCWRKSSPETFTREGGAVVVVAVRIFGRRRESYERVQSKSDYSLYTISDKGVFLALLVYVNYIIITGNSVFEIEKFKVYLKSKFKVVDTDKGICLNQRKYVLDLIIEYAGLYLMASVFSDNPESGAREPPWPQGDIFGYENDVRGHYGTFNIGISQKVIGIAVEVLLS
ncbi:hypothetical protein Tco_0374162 [Tanacetum coccineum]